MTTKRLCEICGKPIPEERQRYWTAKTCSDEHAAELRRRTFREWKAEDRKKKKKKKRKEKANHGSTAS